MLIHLLFFGISADLVEASKLEVSLDPNTAIRDLKERLRNDFPTLENLQDYAIAINEEYADDRDILYDGDIVAVIPPVSGG